LRTPAARAAGDRRVRKANGHDADRDPGFLAFWTAYPRKDSKAEAAKIWAKLKPSSELVERMISAVTRAATSPAWLRDGGQYIPYASKWLNGRRWEDVGSSNEPVLDDLV